MTYNHTSELAHRVPDRAFASRAGEGPGGTEALHDANLRTRQNAITLVPPDPIGSVGPPPSYKLQRPLAVRNVRGGQLPGVTANPARESPAAGTSP